ncbi:MAG TPA: ABC transporter permease [Actinomycetota bacterium]
MEVFIRTILLGIVTGSVYALASTGLVLTYKTSGILNLGYGALALFTTFIHWQLTTWGVPVWVAAAIVLLVVAPLVGLTLDRQLFRRLEGQPQIIGVIATVGLFVLLQGIVILVWGGDTRSVPSLFPSGTIGLPGGANIGTGDLGILVAATLAAGGLGAMLRFTKLGISFRAVVNNRPIAGLMGVNTGAVSSLAWALSTAFAALMGILLTPGLLLDPNILPPFIIAFVLGASVIGYLRSLPLAYLGGLGLGIAQALVIQYSSTQGIPGRLKDALPFLMIAGAVLVAPRALRSSLGASFVVKTREIGTLIAGRARTAWMGAAFLALALTPLVTAGSISWKLALINGMTQAIVFLSLVVLTGYSGQISLGHTAFMGIATFAMAHLVADFGWPSWVAFPLGALAAVPAGALIGFVAVRLQGLFLALMTLAFAFMADGLFFADRRVSGGEGGIPVPRPEGFASETGLFFVTLAVLTGFTLLALNLRSGRTGRVLAGMRDSETACRAVGISVTRYKVMIFGLSAFMAGTGAILNAMILQNANVRTFIPFYSLIFMTLAVLGGIFHPGGAIASGLLFGLFAKFTETAPILGRIQLILFGLGATLALAQNPEGMFGQMRLGVQRAVLLWRHRGARGEPQPVGGGQR